MSIVKEFKEFAIKGNLVDMAVGIIIGGAFGKIITSLVEDIIMPLIAKAFGTADFSNMYIAFSDKIPAGMALADAKKIGPVFAYGNFITLIINFLIIAFCMFIVVKGINKLKKEAEAAPAEPSNEEKLLSEIRDLLKK